MVWVIENHGLFYVEFRQSFKDMGSNMNLNEDDFHPLCKPMYTSFSVTILNLRQKPAQ